MQRDLDVLKGCYCKLPRQALSLFAKTYSVKGQGFVLMLRERTLAERLSLKGPPLDSQFSDRYHQERQL